VPRSGAVASKAEPLRQYRRAGGRVIPPLWRQRRPILRCHTHLWRQPRLSPSAQTFSTPTDDVDRKTSDVADMKSGIARSLLVAAALLPSMLMVGCGATSQGAASPSSRPVAPSPSAISTPPSKASAGGYSANLTFSGGLSGTVTQATAQSGNGSCGGGAIKVEISLNGGDWSLGASAGPYHGPGQYKVPDGASLLLIAPTYDIWFSTAGTATYADDKTLSLDVDMTNGMAPGVPVAHLSGSLSCS